MVSRFARDLSVVVTDPFDSVTCRVRHLKCDEARPQCHNCTKKGKTCRYQSRPSSPGLCSASVEPQHVASGEVTDLVEDHENDDYLPSIDVNLTAQGAITIPNLTGLCMKSILVYLARPHADSCVSTFNKSRARCDELQES